MGRAAALHCRCAWGHRHVLNSRLKEVRHAAHMAQPAGLLLQRGSRGLCDQRGVVLCTLLTRLFGMRVS